VSFSNEPVRRDYSTTGFAIVILGLIFLYSSIFLEPIGLALTLIAVGLLCFAVGIYLSKSKAQAKTNASFSERTYGQVPPMISQKTEVEKSEMIHCRYCGELVPQTAMVCPYCGAGIKS
jgi:hypothetical protein